MKNFQEFVCDKQIDRLVEKCVRENITVVEFVQWYEEEGQYLSEGEFWNNVGAGAAKGAGIGGLAGGIPTGGMGTLAGAGIGGLAGGAYGAGKYLYNKLRGTASGGSVANARKNAYNALINLKTLAGNKGAAELENLLNKIKSMSPAPGTPAPAAPGTPAPAAPGTPGTTPAVPSTPPSGYAPPW